MPKRWFAGNKHPHIALDDAREQAALCIHMMREHLSAQIATVEAEDNWNAFCDAMRLDKDTGAPKKEAA